MVKIVNVQVVQNNLFGDNDTSFLEIVLGEWIKNGYDVVAKILFSTILTLTTTVTQTRAILAKVFLILFEQ